ncbi:MAG: hypothetical protein AAB642_02395, partial [Patescibacteria group bacterium]
NRGVKGTGASSGTALYGAGSDTASNGARITKAIPTVERVALASAKFANLNDQNLFRFKVTAPAGTNGISLYKFTFNVATAVSGYLQELPGDGDVPPELSGFRVTNFRVYCYSDAAFSLAACPNVGATGGLLNGTGVSDESTIMSSSTPGLTAPANDVDINVTFNPTSPSSATTEGIKVDAGASLYFVLKADVTGASSTPSISTKLQGDASFASIVNAVGSFGDASAIPDGVDTDLTSGGDDWTNGFYIFATTAANVDLWDDNDFIWSGNSTNTAAVDVNTYDWFNGFLVSGLSNTDVGQTEIVTLSQ